MIGDIWRLARLAATLRRTGALSPVLEAMGVARPERALQRTCGTRLFTRRETPFRRTETQRVT